MLVPCFPSFQNTLVFDCMTNSSFMMEDGVGGEDRGQEDGTPGETHHLIK